MEIQISKIAFEEDGYVMPYQHPETKAQAKIMCTQRTSGMMMGNKYRILIQTPNGNGAISTYKSLGRGDSAVTAGVKWLKDNGFVSWKKPMPNFVGKYGKGEKFYDKGVIVEGKIIGYHMQHIDAWNKRMCPWISPKPGWSSPCHPESLEIYEE